MIERALRGFAVASMALMVMSAVNAEAQSVDDSPRAMLYLAVGGGGEADFSSDPSSPLDGSLNNEATVGVGARVEFPIMDYVSLGGQVELLSYEIDGAGFDREISGHFDLWAKGRYVFELSSDLDLEAYAGIPIGFSVVSIQNSPGLEHQDNYLGWNMGLLMGGQLFFSERFGAMLEMGWRHINAHNQIAGGGADLKTKVNQFALNLGAVVLF